ncbi:MAG: FctA domain-containing protein [Hespellia sp.]|nr:FctA domain-containing protein [Hespellia sp.]
MTMISVIGLFILLILLCVGFGIRRYTKNRLKDIDGLIQISNREDMNEIEVGEPPEKKKKKWFFGVAIVGLLLAGIHPAQASEKDVLDVYLTVKIQVNDEKGKNLTADETKENPFVVQVISESEQLSVEQENYTWNGCGTLGLGSYTFRKSGTYVLLIKQEAGTDLEYTYDQSVYQVLIAVSQDENGKLSSEVRYLKDGTEVDGIVFYNTRQNAVDVSTSYNMNSFLPGTEITQTVTVHNRTDQTVTGIRIRDYMPEQCLYLSHAGSGSYGAIKGREHVTWYLPELLPGETKVQTVTYRVNLCVSDQEINGGSVLYEITGDEIPWPVNDPKDPERSI